MKIYELDRSAYNPFKTTAIKRDSLSIPVRYLVEKNLLQGRILDYGCGRGFDVESLRNQGYNIIGYDKYNLKFKEESLLNKSYDTVMCNYVFNVIADLKEHEEVRQLLKSLTNNVYVSVRSDISSVKDTWEYDEENLGYWTPSNSFQRFYTPEMLNSLFGRVSLLRKTSSFIIFSY